MCLLTVDTGLQSHVYCGYARTTTFIPAALGTEAKVKIKRHKVCKHLKYTKILHIRRGRRNGAEWSKPLYLGFFPCISFNIRFGRTNILRCCHLAGLITFFSVYSLASKQTLCSVSSSQRVTAPGCNTVTVHNRLCFGQCSSLFVPPQAEFTAAAAPHLRHNAPCSRCGPSKARTVLVPLLCGRGRAQQKRALVVEECKCETSQEERSAEELL